MYFLLILLPSLCWAGFIHWALRRAGLSGLWYVIAFFPLAVSVAFLILVEWVARHT